MTDSHDDETFVRTAQEALMRALVRTADARRTQGRHADAARLYGRALKIAEELLGPQHPVTAAIVMYLSRVAGPQDAIRDEGV
jgi:hypothetical protein